MASKILRNIPRRLGSQSVNIRSYFSRPKDTGKYEIVQPYPVYEGQLVPDHIEKPSYFLNLESAFTSSDIPILKTEESVDAMRKSCRIAANILKKCEKIIDVGVTTEEIDRFVHSEALKAHSYPSPLHYNQFPKSVCTSVNNVACHGIPDTRPLADGDIINVDITVYHKQHHGDCSATFMVGNVDELGQYLVHITKECLDKAIEICGPGVPFKEIGRIIESHANANGLQVIPDFVGHGIGRYFHEPPHVCHYENNYPGEMKKNLTFTIEPILTLGSPTFKVLADQWTAVTKDNARTAQFEHTILITEKGYEVLTIPDADDATVE